ncbi:MAG TPA: DNA primase [Pseudomonadales bacterium]|nr:DNA primase [Pseudomonadales bacterium]
MSGRIPQQFIDDLLERVDIVDVIDARIGLRKSGRNYSALCPFHNEKSPSFSVNPERQFYYCFGCGAGGNAIGFLMEYERLDFPAAVERLASVAGVEVPHEGMPARASTRQMELAASIDAAARWFCKQLTVHPQANEARQYLAKRGLGTETIARFGIGFAPPGWENLLGALGASEPDRKLLLEAGLLVTRNDGTPYDRFRHRIMFPIRDNRGRTVAFGGRVLDDEKPKYLNSPETALFHKGQELYGLFEARQAVRQLDSVLVVEGYMDVVMLAQHGIANATGTLGTALTPAHLQRLYRYTPRVVFCFDGDDAGRRAAARALDTALAFMQDGRQAAFLFLPEGEDPDSLVRRVGGEAFRDLVVAATPLSEFLFEHHASGIDLATVDGRAALSKVLLPGIERIPGTVFRELMRNALAQRIGVTTEQLPRAAGTAESSAPVPRELPPSRIPPAPQRTPPHQPARQVPGLVRNAIRLLLQNPALITLVPDDERLAALEEADLPLLRQLVQRLRVAPQPTLGVVLGYWYDTPDGELLARLAADNPVPGADVEREFCDLMTHLQHRVTRQDATQRLRELERIPFGQLSPIQKSQYLELLKATKR